MALLQSLLFYLQNVSGLQLVYGLALVLGILLLGLCLLGDFHREWAGIWVWLLFFGGLGLLLYGRVGMVGSAILAGGGGCAVAAVLYRLILRPRQRSGQTAAAKAAELVGCLGRVSAPIRSDAMGAIQISTGQGVLSYAACLADGTEQLLDEGELAEILAVQEQEQSLVLTVRRFPEEEQTEL